MSAPSAAAVSRQLHEHKRLKAWRQKVLVEYQQWFGSALLTLPGEASGHLAVVKLKTPGHALAVRRRLSKLHIDHSLHYPIPAETQCPGAQRLTEQLISLPCHAQMRKHDVLLVSRNVQTAV
jgi:dTDP-4-amino-4,6-dideoxygalactose transaminase